MHCSSTYFTCLFRRKIFSLTWHLLYFRSDSRSWGLFWPESQEVLTDPSSLKNLQTSSCGRPMEGVGDQGSPPVSHPVERRSFRVLPKRDFCNFSMYHLRFRKPHLLPSGRTVGGVRPFLSLPVSGLWVEIIRGGGMCPEDQSVTYSPPGGSVVVDILLLTVRPSLPGFTCLSFVLGSLSSVNSLIFSFLFSYTKA